MFTCFYVVIFSSDAAKKREFSIKLSETYNKLGDVDKALESLHSALQGDDDAEARIVWNSVISLLTQQKQLTPQQLTMVGVLIYTMQ